MKNRSLFFFVLIKLPLLCHFGIFQVFSLWQMIDRYLLLGPSAAEGFYPAPRPSPPVPAPTFRLCG